MKIFTLINKLDLRYLVFTILLAGVASIGNAATCSVQCHHRLESEILKGNAHHDNHADFNLSCREMGGTPQHNGSYLSCRKVEEYTTTEYGSGADNNQARVAARSACSTLGCAENYCGGTISRHQAYSDGTGTCQ